MVNWKQPNIKFFYDILISSVNLNIYISGYTKVWQVNLVRINTSKFSFWFDGEKNSNNGCIQRLSDISTSVYAKNFKPILNFKNSIRFMILSYLQISCGKPNLQC